MKKILLSVSLFFLHNSVVGSSEAMLSRSLKFQPSSSLVKTPTKQFFEKCAEFVASKTLATGSMQDIVQLFQCAIQNNNSIAVQQIIDDSRFNQIPIEVIGLALVNAIKNKNQFIAMQIINSNRFAQISQNYLDLALIQACRYDQIKVVAALLRDSRVKVNDAKNDRGFTPLVIAAQNGHAEVVRLLLEAHANVDQSLGDGTTPLYIAAANGHAAIVTLLLKAHAIVDPKRRNGATPLFIAAQKGHAGIVTLLLKAHAIVDQSMDDGATPLFIAAQNGHAAIVELLLAAHANVDQQRRDGTTPLYIAAEKGHAAIVRLLKAHANIDQQRSDGATPLYAAAANGHTEVVRLLLEAHANVNQQLRDDGSTPLYIAAQNGHAVIVELLLAVGAQVDQQRRNGATPLYAAAQNGHAEVVRLLLAAGANVNQQLRDDGATPLYAAAERLQAIQAQVPLDNAAKMRYELVIKLLKLSKLSRALKSQEQLRDISPDARLLKDAYDQFLRGNIQALHDVIFNRLRAENLLVIMKEIFKPECIRDLLILLIQNEREKNFIKAMLKRSVEQAIALKNAAETSEEKKIKLEDDDRCTICHIPYSEIKTEENNTLIPMSCCKSKNMCRLLFGC